MAAELATASASCPPDETNNMPSRIVCLLVLLTGFQALCFASVKADELRTSLRQDTWSTWERAVWKAAVHNSDFAAVADVDFARELRTNPTPRSVSHAQVLFWLILNRMPESRSALSLGRTAAYTAL